MKQLRAAALLIFVLLATAGQAKETTSVVAKTILGPGEAGENLLRPDAWRPLGKGFEHQDAWFVCDNGGQAKAQRGIGQTVKLNQTRPEPILAVCESKAEGVGGATDRDYSLYVDLIYADDTPLTLWNSDPPSPHLDIIGGEVSPELKPVTIVGARNGVFSGKVVVSSDRAIQNLSAKTTDLVRRDGTGKISATNVQVRYATGWCKSSWNLLSKAGSTFDILNEEPVNVGLYTYRPYQQGGEQMDNTWMKAGRAYLPVWVTVNVPADAAAGEYEGRLSMSCGATVPVRLTVHGYTLPKPAEFRTFIEVIQSPDSVALRYDVPLWSDAHWRLIEKSMRYQAMLGNRTVYVPLICESNFGNAESMVRWIKEGENRYTFDFSVMERYLDLQTRIQGRPEIVCFVLWDAYLEGARMSDDSVQVLNQRATLQGKGPGVTLLDPATKRLRKLLLPPRTEPAGKAVWQQLLVQLHELMKKRGLERNMCFGMSCDSAPDESVVKLVEETLPGSQWVIAAHSFYGGKENKASFRYAAFVWGAGEGGFASGRQGWKNPFLLTMFMRNMCDDWPITAYRLAPELNVSGGKRGVGRIGLDFWECFKDKHGRVTGQVWERYPKANWRNLNITAHVIHPGKDGPLGTARFEMLREGLQECEARIFIEMAIESGRLRPALSQSLKDLLKQRDAFHRTATGITGGNGWDMWNWQTSPPLAAYLAYGENGAWQRYSDKLYKASAETATAPGTNSW